jgi:hypothetical protein
LILDLEPSGEAIDLPAHPRLKGILGSDFYHSYLAIDNENLMQNILARSGDI